MSNQGITLLRSQSKPVTLQAIVTPDSTTAATQPFRWGYTSGHSVSLNVAKIVTGTGCGGTTISNQITVTFPGGTGTQTYAYSSGSAINLNLTVSALSSAPNGAYTVCLGIASPTSTYTGLTPTAPFITITVRDVPLLQVDSQGVQSGPCAPSSTQSCLVVYAAGSQFQCVAPQVTLTVRNPATGTWNTIGTYNASGDYRVRPFPEMINTAIGWRMSPSDVRLTYTNDAYNQVGGNFNPDPTNPCGDDRNLYVDKIVVNGKVSEAESGNTYQDNGTQNCADGYFRQEKLWCNGYFQFGQSADFTGDIHSNGTISLDNNGGKNFIPISRLFADGVAGVISSTQSVTIASNFYNLTPFSQSQIANAGEAVTLRAPSNGQVFMGGSGSGTVTVDFADSGVFRSASVTATINNAPNIQVTVAPDVSTTSTYWADIKIKGNGQWDGTYALNIGAQSIEYPAYSCGFTLQVIVSGGSANTSFSSPAGEITCFYVTPSSPATDVNKWIASTYTSPAINLSTTGLKSDFDGMYGRMQAKAISAPQVTTSLTAPSCGPGEETFLAIPNGAIPITIGAGFNPGTCKAIILGTPTQPANLQINANIDLASPIILVVNGSVSIHSSVSLVDLVILWSGYFDDAYDGGSLDTALTINGSLLHIGTGSTGGLVRSNGTSGFRRDRQDNTALPSERIVFAPSIFASLASIMGTTVPSWLE
jgi:hypothetical protein